MSRYAYSHFCDDIRQEIEGKITLVGMYSSEMFVPTFPVVIPKLCVVAYCHTLIDKPFENLTFRVVMNGNVINEFIPDPEGIVQTRATILSQGSPDDPITSTTLGVHLVMSPFSIEKPSSVSVIILADGEEFLAGKLRIKQQRSEQSSPAAN